MMHPSDKEIVGYCRPPKHTRWEKGQSGCPGNKRKAKKLSRIIEDIFCEEIDIVEGGIKRRITVFEAILLQLWLKQSKGNRRAMRMLQRYEAFAKTKPQYIMMTEQDREASAKAYEGSLNEPSKRESEKFANLSVKEAAEMYYAMLREE